MSRQNHRVRLLGLLDNVPDVAAVNGVHTGGGLVQVDHLGLGSGLGLGC